MKKIFLLALIIALSISYSFSQESNVKYQKVNGHYYKFTYFENQKLKQKEEVYPIENSDKYRSLDYYEKYGEDGNMIFKGNKINGRQLTFYPNGQMKTQAAVMDSKLVGEKIFFSEDGKKIKSEIYENGKLIKTVAH